MQIKSALLISSLAVLAAASPLAARTDGTNQCNTGSSQCCNQSGQAKDFEGNVLFGLISALVSDLTIGVGLGCSPILGGGSCNQQPVCCTGNNILGGLLAIGCSPIIL